MDFKKNRRPAYVLYYMMIAGCVLISFMILMLTVSLFTESEHYIMFESIELEIEQLAQYDKIESGNIAINVSNHVHAGATVFSAKNDFTSSFLWFRLWTILRFILIGIVLFLFSKIAKTVIDKEPFHEKNSKYLYYIGFILITSPILYFLFNLYINSVFNGINFPEGIHYISEELSLDWNFTIFGIFILALAYVFKEGTRMHKEQQLTV